MATDALNSSAETLESIPAVDSRWSLAKRVTFRFAFCYWLLYCLPDPFAEGIPEGRYLTRSFDWFWHGVTPWAAQHFFHLGSARIRYIQTGSGDTTLDFVQNFLIVLIAAASTTVWSLWDRKRKDYDTLFVWLRLLVRFTLAFALLSYGIFKIIPTQFPPPALMRLTETYGESSPMGLLWTFMGASMPYTIFGGLAEATAGMLLVFRRTVLLGSVVATGVLLNIVVLNFCYDVPVKLYSLSLLLMALFLAMPDASRLADVFFFNRTVRSAELTRPHLRRRWMRIAAKMLTLALVTYLVISTAWISLFSLRERRTKTDVPVYGAFEVEGMTIDGKPAEAVDPANANWSQMIAENHFWLLKKTDGTRAYFAPTFSPKTKAVDLYSWKTHMHFSFGYRWRDAQQLVLTGKVGDENVSATLRKIDGEFLLMHRGFHWINEQPFNR
jgi:hypothetical protein